MFNTKNIIIVILGLVVSGFIWSCFFMTDKTIDCASKYEFIRSNLDCDKDPQVHTNQMKNKITSIVDEYLKSKKAQKISVFYRNLENLQWFGVGENENFDPASLLKLPLAVAYYKIAGVDSGILLQQYEYKPSGKSDSLYTMQYVKSSSEVKENNIYSVEELITRMIKYSDNEVVPVLSSTISPGFLNKVYVDLGINIPLTGGIKQDFVSVKTYSALLRTLYNASYLNQYYSNHILEIMSNSEFKEGIVAGLPSGIKVANKFGERVIKEEGTGKILETSLHDCGIIYAKDSPYILCLMTSGEKFEELPDIISNISKEIYNMHESD